MLEPLVHRTPTVSSRTLSARAGRPALLKLENMQKTGSFKPRGALVNIHGLSGEQRRSSRVARKVSEHRTYLTGALTGAANRCLTSALETSGPVRGIRRGARGSRET